MSDKGSSVFLFSVQTLLGFNVRTTTAYWETIANFKHPILRGKVEDVKQLLKDPDVVRRSRRDYSVFLFYKRRESRRWLCAVAKRLNGEGFLVTAYVTDAVKEGDLIWTK